MFNIVTVANNRYIPFVKRLFTSLQTSGNDFHLTVFCDDADAFRGLGRVGRCTVRELAEIRSIGLPRARFVAYATALQEGGFLYLDSDVIVLKPIEELVQNNQITGCYDDLSCVPIIPDKRHPWAGDPTLENRCFINAGVFFAPRARREFFKELLKRSRNDELWQQYGILQDNSFLCAHFNLLDEPVHYVDSLVYNWQGLVKNGKLQVKRQGDSLVNCTTGQVLKIAHFAGVPDPDAAMCKWPVEVTALLAARSADNGYSRHRSLVEFLGTLNPDFDDEARDPVPRAFLNALVSETVDLASSQLHRNSAVQDSYLMDRETMLSLIYSRPPSYCRWNGLPCGGSSLDGDEYNFLLTAIRDLHIQTAMYTKTEEISELFSKFNVEALPIQSTPQPCLDRTDNNARRFLQAHSDPQTRGFDQGALRQAIESSGIEKFDLLVFAPPLTSRATEQLVSVVRPKYLAFHDVHRMLEPVFASQQRFSARLVGYLNSLRGLALLELPSSVDPAWTVSALSGFKSGVTLVNPRVQIQLADDRVTPLPGNHRRIFVTVTNHGEQILSPRYDFPVTLSYHWMTSDNEVGLWDGVRSALPFDILPGCAATFEARIGPAPEPSWSLVCLTLIQESVGWFEDSNPDNRLLVRLDGDHAEAA